MKKILTTINNFNVIDYSAKCVAVQGDTKPIKDMLKGMDGLFNRNLTDADGKSFPGWIFKKDKLDTLVAALKEVK